jgi:two-component system, NtrC family, response regulator AtoC
MKTEPDSLDSRHPHSTVTTERDVRNQITGRLQLLVMGEGAVINHPLPDVGDLVIGRSHDNDIQVEDRGISRRHARLRLGPPMTIEDLGSSNGVRVRGERLQPNTPAEIRADEPFELGGFLAVVQHRTNPIRVRRIWPHDYFEGRLSDECARAERSGDGFVLLRLHVDVARNDVSLPEVLGHHLRTIDVVGLYAPGEYEVLLVDTTPEAAAIPLRRISTELDSLAIRHRTGVAAYPRDGRDADSLVAKASALARGAGTEPGPGPVVVTDGAMESLRHLVERVATGTLSVLILGETGVGKEVMAEAVHRLSPRAQKPFLRLNCAALSESLLESELFGHEKGAFTGAVQAKAGLLESAQGGTVFIDEVGEMPLSLQVKLLRVLEERQVLPVGALRPRKIDVRFVAATNRDLEAEVLRGAFRQDLYFRLNGVTLVIPPLRERVGEIDGLAHAFIPLAAKEAGRSSQPRLSGAALDLLERYSWPGNIRELRNVIQRAVLLCGDEITPAHLPVQKMEATFAARSEHRPTLASALPPRVVDSGRHGAPAPVYPSTQPNIEVDRPIGRSDGGPLASQIKDEMRAIERKRIQEVLELCAGNQTRAATMLGISRRTLVNRIEAYDLPRPRKGRASPNK